MFAGALIACSPPFRLPELRSRGVGCGGVWGGCTGSGPVVFGPFGAACCGPCGRPAGGAAWGRGAIGGCGTPG
ncbi:hypothetical protein, partial [Actinomadura sp. CNU-125]|uniref:hypothetical protein n=1 Tax=Actinomadura sp. CNU-125 TaxID=1904961 RepID=UPI0021CC6C88